MPEQVYRRTTHLMDSSETERPEELEGRCSGWLDVSFSDDSAVEDECVLASGALF